MNTHLGPERKHVGDLALNEREARVERRKVLLDRILAAVVAIFPPVARQLDIHLHVDVCRRRPNFVVDHAGCNVDGALRPRLDLTLARRGLNAYAGTGLPLGSEAEAVGDVNLADVLRARAVSVRPQSLQAGRSALRLCQRYPRRVRAAKSGQRSPANAGDPGGAAPIDARKRPGGRRRRPDSLPGASR